MDFIESILPESLGGQILALLVTVIGGLMVLYLWHRFGPSNIKKSSNGTNINNPMGYVEDVNIYMNKDEIRVSIKKATGINVADLIEKLEEKRVIGSRAITKKEKKDDQ